MSSMWTWLIGRMAAGGAVLAFLHYLGWAGQSYGHWFTYAPPLVAGILFVIIGAYVVFTLLLIGMAVTGDLSQKGHSPR